MSWLEWTKALFRTQSQALVQDDNPVHTETWQERVRRLQLPESARIPVASALPTSPLTKAPLIALQGATIERALALSGVISSEEEAPAVYFINLFQHNKFLCSKELVRSFSPMSIHEKKLMGIKSRAIIGLEFASLLNETGRSDPIEAAGKIARIVNKQRSTVVDLMKVSDFLDGDTRLRFFPSNMAAGPCEKAQALSRKLIEPSEADLLPFEECGHPDQCGCRYLMKRFK